MFGVTVIDHLSVCMRVLLVCLQLVMPVIDWPLCSLVPIR